MGSGASAAKSLTDDAETASASVRDLSDDDLARAEEFLGRAQRLVAQERRARQSTGVGVAGSSETNLVNVQGLDGSSFQLEVDPNVSVEDVSKLIAEKIEMKPGRRLVLSSGGSILDESQELMQQLDARGPRELSFVLTPINLLQAAKILWKALAVAETKNRLTAADLSAMNAITSLTFGDDFNQSLTGAMLPRSLKVLTFGSDFNHGLGRVALPSNLQTLNFGEYYNQSLAGVRLPSSVKTLTFGSTYNQSLAGVTLPNSLETLTFGWNFNQSLEGVTLPNSIQTLTFGEMFDQDLRDFSLPSSLQILTFGTSFDQSLSGVTLPETLQTLTFGSTYNQRLEGVTLPRSLKTLTFGEEFNRSLTKVALPALESLTFGVDFNQALEDLPSSLETLTFGDQFSPWDDDLVLDKLRNFSCLGFPIRSELKKLMATGARVEEDAFRQRLEEGGLNVDMEMQKELTRIERRAEALQETIDQFAPAEALVEKRASALDQLAQLREQLDFEVSQRQAADDEVAQAISDYRTTLLRSLSVAQRSYN